MKVEKIAKVRFSDEEEMILKKAKDILQKVSKDFENGNYDLYGDHFENGMEDVISDIYCAVVKIF